MVGTALDRCQRWRYNRAECSLCIQACPVDGCIRYENGTLCISKERCVGCGICTGVCPSGALFMEYLDDSDLWNKLKNKFEDNRGKHSLVLGCYLNPKQVQHGLSYSSATFINLPCLAILKESHLVAIILSGIEKIYIDASRCAECSFHHGKDIIEKTISDAQTLLSAMGRHGQIKLLDSPATDDGLHNLQAGKQKPKRVKEISSSPEFSRREFFLSLRGKRSERDGGDKPQGRSVNRIDSFPGRRAVLLESLRTINGSIPGDVTIKEGEFPVHQVEINENCALCHSCELFCPTGALKRVEDDGAVRIDFQMALCVGCYQCKELCPEEAIYYNEQIDLKHLLSNEVRTLVRRVQKACPECGRSYFPETQGGCPTCGNRRALDKRIIAILTGEPMM